MELTLTRQSGTQVLVTCESQSSHTFDLLALLPHEKGLPQPLDNPVVYGQAIYAALFPPKTAAHRTLADAPKRILLVTTDNDVDAVPWEYVYGSYGSEDSESFLVQECHFVRGVPADQRIAPPTLDTSLHIVAVPSNPLSHELDPLNIEGEWLRLKEIIQHVSYAITLERTRPPSIELVRTLVANQRQRVIHFMGHGGQQEAGAVLSFEKDNGELDLVTAKQFLLRVRGTVFLVTLNACVTATPGATGFSNLAAALARQKTPYALGMRFSILDEEARSFSRTFYSDLARGISVEEALLQARLTLANSSRSWALGVPVLYTSLEQPATGFASQAGLPLIREHQPPMEVSALPRAEGTFQGRIDELTVLGMALTGDSRPPLVTIHGGGGQGKTALAREAAERFAHAWPGGVWAASLENLPSRELFVSDLARFLGIDTETVANPDELERLVLAHIDHRRTLIVLDNAETLVDAVEANNEEAISLAQFLREQLPRPPVSLLATSRSFLGWTGEIGCELTGLALIEGVRLFQQHAPQREKDVDQVIAWELSEQIEGHPLSLRLLGSAFNASSISFAAFVKEYEAQLLGAENKYMRVDHRHRTLHASIETSVRYLDDGLADLFSRLWLFHAPFLPETAVAVFDPEDDATKDEASPVYDRLNILWRRGLLVREEATLREGTVQFYRVLSTIRPYIETYLAQVEEREQLVARFGVVYADLVRYLYRMLDRGSVAAFIAFQAREDLERGASCVMGVARGYYLLYWGWILQQLIDTRRGLKLIEQALEIGQSQDRQLKLLAINNMGLVYQATGQPQQALELYEQALQLRREMGDRAGEAATLNNMGLVYRATGHPQQALELLEQALPLKREMDDRDGAAATLNNMAEVYQATGQPQRSLELFEQALTINREVGNRAGEATTLNNMATVYQATGQPQRSLELYEQALTIHREVGNRAMEANTLSNMAAVYQTTGQSQRALEVYEQALPIRRAVGDRVGEATILKNIADVYRTTGQPQRALELLEQALTIDREVDNRAGEAATLNGLAEVYRTTGQPQRALELLEQALLLMREVGDRAGEAATLNGLAVVYRATGQPQQALELLERALLLMREVDNRAGEATTLSGLAEVYRATGQSQRALELLEQALTIDREVDNRAGEAATLNNIADVYRTTGQPKRALELFEQALLLMREVGDRAGEAATLNNIAEMYRTMGQPQQALELHKQVLPLMREVGDRAGEARTLNNMAAVYQATGQPRRALELHEQALPIRRAVGDRAGEAATLANMAIVLYRDLSRSQEAITKMEQAIAVLLEAGLFQDAAGQSRDDMQRYLNAMRQGLSPDQAIGGLAVMPAAQIQQIITNTVAVMTTVRESRAKWYEAITEVLKQAKSSNRQQDADFFTAVLAILNGESPTLSSNHFYASALAQIQEGIAASELEDNKTPRDDSLSSDQIQEILSNTVAVMTTMQERRALWRETIANLLQDIQQQGTDWQIEVEFFSAIIDILDGRSPTLAPDHPFAQAVAAIQDGIAIDGRKSSWWKTMMSQMKKRRR
jgi:tetratricopeptide (TPR) repeat protein